MLKEINIGKIIVDKRHEKGISQNELAEYLGVSKAAVSKWETGQSYPDIELLPALAAFFNISIDQLMDYKPQMVKKDIRKLYRRLAKEMSEKPFPEVMKECEELIKKYYCCYPLLLQMAVLLINHCILAENAEEVLMKTVKLCSRIREESKDADLMKQAVLLEANCWLAMSQPERVLDLVGEKVTPMMQKEEILAMAYQAMGEHIKARRTLQISMYQHLVSLIGEASDYIRSCMDDQERGKMVIGRTLGLINLYHAEELHLNSVLVFYLTAAQCFCVWGEKKEAMDMIGKYIHLCVEMKSQIVLHGDLYFDLIEDWFSEFDLGKDAPRNEAAVRASMLSAVTDNPAFSILSEEPEYKTMCLQFRNDMGGK